MDDGPYEHFAVMAGIGIDAVIMEGTNPDLKSAVGPAAYFVSAARHANHPALHATIRVDREPPLRRRAHVLVIGNVGVVTGNIALMPDARPDDATLDVLVASPRGPPGLGSADHQGGRPAEPRGRPARPTDRVPGADQRRPTGQLPAGRRHDRDLSRDDRPGRARRAGASGARAVRRAIEQGAGSLELTEIAEQELAADGSR